MPLVNRGCLLRVLLGLALISVTASQAVADTTADISVNVVRREDNLNWSIAGNSINVLSELQWEKLAISQLSIDSGFNFPKNFRLSAHLDFGRINSGINRDSDYNGSDRTLEYSRSINKAGGYVADASVGLGKVLRFDYPRSTGKFYLTPLVGLSIHQQNLTMTDGVQVISASSTSPPLGQIAGLNSSYNAQWMGPWWGLNARWDSGRRLAIDSGIEYHLADYTAKANWNLRTDFAHPVSFTHHSNGEGLVMNVSASYSINARWKMGLMMSRQRWKAHAGTDLVFLSDGTMGSARLNEVNWESNSVSVGVSRQF